MKGKGNHKCGRPKILKNGTTTSVSFDIRHLEAVHILGNGNVSKGLRIMIEDYIARHPKMFEL